MYLVQPQLMSQIVDDVVLELKNNVDGGLNFIRSMNLM